MLGATGNRIKKSKEKNKRKQQKRKEKGGEKKGMDGLRRKTKKEKRRRIVLSTKEIVTGWKNGGKRGKGNCKKKLPQCQSPECACRCPDSAASNGAAVGLVGFCLLMLFV